MKLAALALTTLLGWSAAAEMAKVRVCVLCVKKKKKGAHVWCGAPCTHAAPQPPARAYPYNSAD